MNALGCDVSHWQGEIDFEKMRKAGASFVFIKASQATWMDKRFQANWHGAKRAGLLRGAYHYLDWTRPAADQANTFIALIKDDPGELPPVLDYEERKGAPSPAAAWAAATIFLSRVESALRIRPMIYTSPGYWADYGKPAVIPLPYPLWIAHYGVSKPSVPPAWTTWMFWQFTDRGDGASFGVQSKQIDLNYYNGSAEDMIKRFGGPASEQDEENEKPKDILLKVVAQRLNVRDQPYYRGRVVEILNKDDVVTMRDLYIESAGRVWVKHDRGWSALVFDGEVLMRGA